MPKRMEADSIVTTDTSPAPTDSQRLASLKQAAGDVMLRDAERLERRLAGLNRRLRDNKPISRGLEEVQRELSRAQQQLSQRENQQVALNYPPELPVVERREDIINAIRDHQVVVVAGRPALVKPPSCLKCVWNWAGAAVA
ncbi:hypothetical protein HORIV_43600 [Vreelandella olivaria]|uniref:Uncharacterized protein n=1 Tax=Vreelandella olivaria TaxID=390919 RepID=A0ABM8HL88_9GAMM|nr:hypothetical protein HORIV_43600 [Halomonas olivaria]